MSRPAWLWWARRGVLTGTATYWAWQTGLLQFCHPCGDVIVRAGHRRGRAHRRTIRAQRAHLAELRAFLAANPGALERAARLVEERRRLPSDG